MNKKILIITCLVITITIFSGCTSQEDDKNKTEVKNENSVEQNQENSENNNIENNIGKELSCSMQDLIDRNESLKCVYEYTTEKIEKDGLTATAIFYVADDKTRNEIEINYPERKTEITSIILGEWVYTWHSLTPLNLKIHINDLQDEVYDQNEVVNLNEKKDFKCQSWTADNSKFVIPADREFEDMTQALKDYQKENPIEEVITESKNALCDVCQEYSSKEKKEKCLIKYKCK